MGYSPDESIMYYTDSSVRTIYAYDYDRATGSVSNRRDFVKLPDTAGVPDGMTVDSEGYVWTAVWFDGCIVRFDPDGVEERRIALPAIQTSSVMFGGPDLTDIYVTTRRDRSGTRLASRPQGLRLGGIRTGLPRRRPVPRTAGHSRQA